MKRTMILVALVASVGLFWACDKSSDFGDIPYISITPAQVTLSGQQQTIMFTASGGNFPYRWSVEDEDAGSIVSDGSNAIYTASGSSGGGNIVKVTDERFWTATATILQVEPLSITAAQTSISATNGTATLVADGGLGSYTWQIQTTPSGSLSSATGPTTTYTSSGVGTEVVVLSDGNSSVAVSITKT